MLGIYADTFMTATRTGPLEMHEVPPKHKGARRRWFSRRRRVMIDPKKI